MTSVWKRIQRVGKRASKFQFIASYQTLMLECCRDGKWQPNKLSVLWTRRNRRKAVKPETWQPSIANPFRGMIVWTDPEEVEISVTLYKDAREGSPYEDKLWTFVIEDESINGKRRPVASVSVNMADYHSIDLQTFCLNLPLRPASKKVVSASLELNLACVLLKEGNATDEDMISMSSLLSLNDPYGSNDLDTGRNFKRNAGKRLSLRSVKTHNKPTFNMSTSSDHSKQARKSFRDKSKRGKNELLNKSFPLTNHVVPNALNVATSTSDTCEQTADTQTRPTLKKRKSEEKMSRAEESLLKWCQDCVVSYENVEVIDMTSSWKNGLAFCAIVHYFHPNMIDFANLKADDIRENNRLAFEAFEYLGISRMLDPNQMVLSSIPDKLLIMTYLHQIKEFFTKRTTSRERTEKTDDDKVSMAVIAEAERKLRLNTASLLKDMEKDDFAIKNEYSKKVDKPVDKTEALKDVETDSLEIEKMDILDSNKTDTLKVDEKDTFDNRSNNVDKTKKLVVTKRDTSNDRTVDSGDDQVLAQNNSQQKLEYEANPGLNPFDEDDHIAQSDVKAVEDRRVDNKLNYKISAETREKDWNKEKNIFSENKLEDSQENDNVSLQNPKPQRKEISSKNLDENTTGENKIHHEDPWRREGSAETGKQVSSPKRKLGVKNSNPVQQVYFAKPGYNPFLDDDGDQKVLETNINDRHDAVAGSKGNTSEAGKQGSLNPFDEDYVDDEEIVVSDIDSVLTRTTKKQSLNPFDDDYEEPFETNIDDDASEEGTVKVPDTNRELGTNETSRIRQSMNDVKSPDHGEQVTNTAKSPLTENLTEVHVTEEGLESENMDRHEKSTPSRGLNSEPASPRMRIPSFEEWKAKKSDEAAKQDARQAQVRQMIKEARAKSVRAQNDSNPNQEHTDKTSASGVTTSSPSLPRLYSSKKYKAPEPPKAGAQRNLTPKLKEEIDAQRKISEKTRKTMETSRIKRVNPRQENVSEVEAKSERREKIEQVIREARDKNSHSPATSPPVGEDGSVVISPPKPPRLYAYRNKVHGCEEPREPGAMDSEGPGRESETKEKGAEQNNKDLQESEENSLHQNPFKLTFKKKEPVPQAVVKPLSAGNVRETKIDLKKYSVKTRGAADTENTENSVTLSSATLPSSQESLSERGRSSEEDVNNILDNVETTSENEEKSDEELYDNGDDEEGFQDTSQYVEHEIAVLEEDRAALDRVAVKLEKELREVMNTEDCKDEEQRLFQEWFLLVNKRNEIVRRQTELSILEKEEDLEKRFELLNRELRFLMTDKLREKTAHEKKREELLLAELVRLVNKRDELVRIEDSQIQEAEKVARHVEHVVRNTKIPKKQAADCCIQ